MQTKSWEQKDTRRYKQTEKKKKFNILEFGINIESYQLA